MLNALTALPAAGDEFNIIPYVVIIAVAVVAVAVLLIIRKRKK